MKKNGGDDRPLRGWGAGRPPRSSTPTEATFFALRTRWSALSYRGGAYTAIARANERSAAKNHLMRAHPASRQLQTTAALPPAAWAHDESIGSSGWRSKTGRRLYGRSARAAPPQSAVRRGTFDLGAIDLRGGRVVGADEARWEDEWDAKFFNLEGKQEVKRSQSGSFAAESSPGGPSRLTIFHLALPAELIQYFCSFLPSLRSWVSARTIQCPSSLFSARTPPH